MGPLDPGDRETATPNGYTSFQVGRTASSIVVMLDSPRGMANVPVGLNELPDDGIVLRGGFVDGGNPGYMVRYWRGG